MCARVPFSLVVFDLDGTLVDSLGDIALALNDVLAGAGLDALPVEEVRTLVGDGVKALVERAVGRQREPLRAQPTEPLVAAMIARYEARPCVVTKPYAGIPELLAELRSNGRRVAVLTNKPGPVARALLDAVGLASSLDAIIGDLDGYPRKPDPTALAALARDAGVDAASTLMVGDGLPDLAVARAFGCASAAVAWGYVDAAKLRAERPTFFVERPADIAGL
jgi:phosphoglycolate phosphatase